MSMLMRVQKKTAIVLFLSAIVLTGRAAAQQAVIPPRPAGYVNDYAGIINPQDRQKITNFAGELEKKTSAQLAVVTVKTTRPETVETYAVRLFEQWGIGQKGKDNGILLLIAAEDRNLRIEVGYGLEGAVTDAISGKVIRDIIVPSFKAGQFSKGIYDGAYALVSLAAKEYNVVITGQEAAVYERVHRPVSPLAKFFNLIFTILFFLLIFGSRSGLLGYFLLGSMLGGRRRGGYWYGAGYGGSRGGFGGGLGGGGFGGFGGGFSGGGGASGSW